MSSPVQPWMTEAATALAMAIPHADRPDIDEMAAIIAAHAPDPSPVVSPIEEAMKQLARAEEAFRRFDEVTDAILRIDVADAVLRATDDQLRAAIAALTGGE